MAFVDEYDETGSVHLELCHRNSDTLEMVRHIAKLDYFVQLLCNCPNVHPWACSFIIFVSDGKFDNSMGIRKRTD